MKPTKWVTGVGRSGTTWLSAVLRSVPGPGHFYHEPCVTIDKEARTFDKDDSWVWWVNTREPQIEKFIANRPKHWADSPYYGECNSMIRYHTAALRRRYPDAPVLHLHRDGRDVVRSMYARRIYTPGAGINNALRPTGDMQWADEWDKPLFGRFGKLCWFWASGAMVADDHATGRIRFDRMVTDYEYFSRAIDPLGIPVSYEYWEARQRHTKTRNATKSQTLPHWRDWSPGMEGTFWMICGEAMGRLGYNREA